MKTILARVSLVVLVLFVLALIALALILVWPGLVLAQPIAVYPQSLENTYTAESTPMAESIKSEYRAWLEVEADNFHLEIKAYCRNNSSKNSVLRYNLRAQKKGRAGRTFSSQSSSVYLRSQEEKCVSQLSLVVSPKDEYEIKLEVYEDGKLVAEDSVFYLPGLRI